MASINTEVVRIQRKNGVIIQDCDVYIGRACNQGGWSLRQSKWHNPFTVKQAGSGENACQLYKTYITTGAGKHLLSDLDELKGKRLGCWCVNSRERTVDQILTNPKCHGEVLLGLIYQQEILSNDIILISI